MIATPKWCGQSATATRKRAARDALDALTGPERVEVLRHYPADSTNEAVSEPEWTVGMLVDHRQGRFLVIGVDGHDRHEPQLSVESVDNPDAGFKDYAFLFKPVSGTGTRHAPMSARLPVSNLPRGVADALRKRGWKDDDRPGIDTAFDEYCDWHGLTNWGPTLRGALVELTRGSKDRVTDVGHGVGFEVGEMDSGELELLLDVEGHTGSVYLSRAMYDAIGHQSGWMPLDSGAADS